jgi:hypothetical protein
MFDALSSLISQVDPSAAIQRLKKAEYVSPQGVPFECGTCQFFKEPKPSRFIPRVTNSRLGFCDNESIQTFVEKEGCCDYWTSMEGVHG